MDAIGEQGGLRLNTVKTLEEMSAGYSYFQTGDVIIAKITPCFENGKGALAEGLENGLAFGTTELHVLRPLRQLDARFLFYLTIGQPFREIGASTMYGASGQQRVADDFVRNFVHPIPPKRAQRFIAAFLDKETAKIDDLLAKKERLIELLQEKRTALITRAVTKGLDVAAPMRDSNVEWLGWVPAHWAVSRLKFASSLQTGVTLGKKYESAPLVARPYLRVANVQAGYLDLNDISSIEIPTADVPRYKLLPGDVVLTEGGDFDKLGRGHVWEGQIPGCLHQNHIFAVRPNTRVLNPYFLASMMGSGYGRAYFTATSIQSTNLASTNSVKLKEFPIPPPELEEQQEILAYVKAEQKEFDQLTAKITEAINRLKEYRAALISAAVTGKIDVREEVA